MNSIGCDIARLCPWRRYVDLDWSVWHVNFRVEHSDFFFMRAFVKFTDPLIKGMAKLTPPFLIDRLKPLYVAWFLFMIRFYIMPLILGYDVMGMLSFPLESDAALIIYDLGKIFR